MERILERDILKDLLGQIFWKIYLKHNCQGRIANEHHIGSSSGSHKLIKRLSCLYELNLRVFRLDWSNKKLFKFQKLIRTGLFLILLVEMDIISG